MSRNGSMPGQSNTTLVSSRTYETLVPPSRTAQHRLDRERLVPQLSNDIRLAFRRARKRPGFTLVAVLSLTLGIGANSAVFSLVNAILLRRAPIPEPDRIVEVYQSQAD